MSACASREPPATVLLPSGTLHLASGTTTTTRARPRAKLPVPLEGHTFLRVTGRVAGREGVLAGPLVAAALRSR